MLRRIALLAIATLSLVAVTTPAAKAETELDFKLVNKTGYGISEIYVSPSAADKWGESIIEDVLEHNESVDISFHPQASGIAKWDVMVTFVDDDEKVYWRGLDLSKISTLTLKYDRESGKTSATAE